VLLLLGACRDAATGELLAESGEMDPAVGITSTPGFGGQYFYFSNQLGGNVYKLSFEVPGAENSTAGSPALAPAPSPTSAGVPGVRRLLAMPLAGLAAAIAWAVLV